MKTLIALALLSLGAASAHADPVTLTFTGLQDFEPINDFYNGGAGGFGTTGGANYGIHFSSDSLAIISNQDGGSGNFSRVPAPGSNTIAFFLSGAGDTMDVATGFTSGFSFYYTSPFYSGSVQVFSGLDGSGTLLATDSLDFTSGYCDPTEPYSCWVNSGVAFSGTAQSVVFSGVADQVGFADITLGASSVPPPGGGGGGSVTPEPSTLVLLGTGVLGAAGGLGRRFRGR